MSNTLAGPAPWLFIHLFHFHFHFHFVASSLRLAINLWNKRDTSNNNKIAHCAHWKLVIAMTFTVVVVFVVVVAVVMHPLAWVHRLVLSSRSFALPALCQNYSLGVPLVFVLFTFACLDDRAPKSELSMAGACCLALSSYFALSHATLPLSRSLLCWGTRSLSRLRSAHCCRRASVEF